MKTMIIRLESKLQLSSMHNCYCFSIEHWKEELLHSLSQPPYNIKIDVTLTARNQTMMIKLYTAVKPVVFKADLSVK